MARKRWKVTTKAQYDAKKEKMAKLYRNPPATNTFAFISAVLNCLYRHGLTYDDTAEILNTDTDMIHSADCVIIQDSQ